MSTAEATVDDTVVVTTVHGKGATAATVLALLAVAQLMWVGALAYGTVWLLT
jgi:uncharacterized membrane protein